MGSACGSTRDAALRHRAFLCRHGASAALSRSTAIAADSSYRTNITSSTAPRDCIPLPFWRPDLRLSLSTGGVASQSSDGYTIEC
jgi:hypothetical protein